MVEAIYMAHSSTGYPPPPLDLIHNYGWLGSFFPPANATTLHHWLAGDNHHQACLLPGAYPPSTCAAAASKGPIAGVPAATDGPPVGLGPAAAAGPHH